MFPPLNSLINFAYQYVIKLLCTILSSFVFGFVYYKFGVGSISVAIWTKIGDWLGFNYVNAGAIGNSFTPKSNTVPLVSGDTLTRIAGYFDRAWPTISIISGCGLVKRLTGL